MAGEVIQSSAGSTPVFALNAQPAWSTYDLERDSQITELRTQVTKLTEKVNRLESIIGGMGAMVSGLPIGFSFVDANDKSLGETKDMIVEYYLAHRGEAIYPDDAANELGLDLRATMKAVKELIGEGRIEEVN